MAMRVTEADGPRAGKRDEAVDEHARRGALDAKVGREDLPKLGSGEGVPLRGRGPRRDPLT
jgi:hypothetical protein